MHDFRNLADIEVELPREGIAIAGDNGQGKTNFLEAIAYAHLLRSIRGARDIDVVRFEAAGFAVAASARVDEMRRTITVAFDRQSRQKWATVDGVRTKRLSDAIGTIPSVTISPVDVALVRGAPGERRRYLDIVLATTSRRYLSALQEYRSALLRRNAALRAGASEATAAVWEPPLAEAGAVLRSERAAWVAQWQDGFARLTAAIGEPNTATLRYAAGRREEAAGADTGEQHAVLAAALEADRPGDVRRGSTRAGPHRDDLAITIEDKPLPTFGSAGQQRTVAIALRLLEAATIRAVTGAAPVLLLDDPFAELDDRRARAVLNLVSDGVDASPGQVVLAVPRESDIPPELVGLERWRIAGGVLTRATQQVHA